MDYLFKNQEYISFLIFFIKDKTYWVFFLLKESILLIKEITKMVKRNIIGGFYGRKNFNR
ncbi:hypothetical protein ADK17_11965 [Bacillus anthracis]|nr:hypothetical protein ADK17_11965 [Bacillus anthracis]